MSDIAEIMCTSASIFQLFQKELELETLRVLRDDRESSGRDDTIIIFIPQEKGRSLKMQRYKGKNQI